MERVARRGRPADPMDEVRVIVEVPTSTVAGAIRALAYRPIDTRRGRHGAARLIARLSCAERSADTRKTIVDMPAANGLAAVRILSNLDNVDARSLAKVLYAGAMLMRARISNQRVGIGALR